MSINHSKIHQSKYVTDVSCILNGKTISLGRNSIADLSVEKEFDKSFMPLLRILFLLPVHVQHLMLSELENIDFRVKFMRVHEINDTTNEKFVDQDSIVVFDEIFTPFALDYTIDPNIELGKYNLADEIMKIQSLESIHNNQDVTMFFELYFFNKKHLIASKKVFNFVANRTEPKNAMAYMINQSNIDKVLMSRPMNSPVYNQIIVPPDTLKNSIELLDTQYGLYEYGIRQFLDFDTYYILENKIEDMPIRKNEYNNVFVEVLNPEDMTHTQIGSYNDDSKKIHQIVCFNSVFIQNNKPLINELSGNNLRIYNRSRLQKSLTVDSGGNFEVGDIYEDVKVDEESNNSKISYIYNPTGAVNATKSEVQLKRQSLVMFSMMFENIDITLFTPNRRFLFNFLSIEHAKEYNGSYMLSDMSYVTSTADRGIKVFCSFKKA